MSELFPSFKIMILLLKWITFKWFHCSLLCLSAYNKNFIKLKIPKCLTE